MTIEEEDFKLIPIDEKSPRFDLELLYTIRPRGGEPRQEFKPSGYGISLEWAIRKIAHYRVYNKHRDEAIKLLTYFKAYKQELDNLKKLLCEI